MKKLLCFLIVAFFSSCTGVYFNSPQPGDGKKFNSVPAELQGKWIENSDTCIVNSSGMYQTESKKDSAGNVISVKRKWTNLSDSILLFSLDKYYVINILGDDGKGYQVVVIDIQSNGDINWYYPLNAPFFGSRKGLEVVKVNRTVKGKRKTDKSLKAVKGEQIDEVYYSGKLNTDDLKKVMLPVNLIWVLKKDGTAVSPQNK